MDLKELVASLEQRNQYALAIDLIERTLPIWDDYASHFKLEYTDSVVGMHHIVKSDLLKRTLKLTKTKHYVPSYSLSEIKLLLEEFSDPIVSIQDCDWDLPYAVEKTFFAFNNLLDYMAGKVTTVFDEPTIYIVINQSIDALVSANLFSYEEINEILDKYRYISK